MCWERLGEHRTDDVDVAQPRDVDTPREEVEWPTVRRAPVEEPAEAGEELARV